jgi:phenylalanyl-tRNA synthetase beta chain
MKITWSGLSRHLSIDEIGLGSVGALDKVCKALTDSGTQASVVRAWEHLALFSLVEIRLVKPHPQADRLNVCHVWDGLEERVVVCGASNVRPGLKTILARSGCCIPSSGQKIQEQSVRGVESRGMLCSAQELMLSQEIFPGDGIIEVNQDGLELGQSLESILDTDPIIELEITPNRGDLFSVRGVAQELAALKIASLKPLSLDVLTDVWGKGKNLLPEIGGDFCQDAPRIQASSLQQLSASGRFFSIQTPLCPLFGVALIRNIPCIASPLWMRMALAKVGMGSISWVVDVTNYICHELGRPLHAFDYDLVQGPLKVRLSFEGEEFESLDAQNYRLPKGFLVIADDKGILALAGVKGGKRAACHEGTRNVLLESAYFHAPSIARAGQYTHIVSGARTRFERGLDPCMVFSGLQMASWLIQNPFDESPRGELAQETKDGLSQGCRKKLSEPCPGVHLGSDKKTEEVQYQWGFYSRQKDLGAGSSLEQLCSLDEIDVSQESQDFLKSLERSIDFHTSSVAKLAGFSMDSQDMEGILKALGCQVNKENILLSSKQKPLKDKDCESSSWEEEGCFWKVTPPSWRHDLQYGEDLVEEVLRVRGYDSIPLVSLPKISPQDSFRSDQGWMRALRHFLTSRGYYETVHWSFIALEIAQLFAPKGYSFDRTTLRNPIRQDMAVMRPSFLPGLLATAKDHMAKKIPLEPMFEIAHRYLGVEIPEQPLCLAGFVLESSKKQAAWGMDRPYSLYRIKEDLQGVLNCVGVRRFQCVNLQEDKSPPWLRPGRCGAFQQGNKILGYFGEIHPNILKHFEIDTAAWAFEVFFENIVPSPTQFPKKFFQVPLLQSVSKNISFIMPKAQEVGPYVALLEKKLSFFKRSSKILGQETVGVNKACPKHFGLDCWVKVVDIFEDCDKIGLGLYSITLDLVLQPYGTSLTHEEIQEIMDQAIQESRQLGGTLRGQWHLG